MAEVKKRIDFIDIARAYAIIYMIISHTIRVVLSESYRSRDILFYKIWEQWSGTTAPIFLMMSGAIFTFLLFKQEGENGNPRIKKGLTRGASLIGIGYLIQFNPGIFIRPEIFSFTIAVHILHCIGLALTIIVGLYKLHRYTKINYSLIVTISALIVAFSFLHIQRADWLNDVPLFFRNWLTQAHGSVFPIIPWVFFVFVGSLGGALLYHNQSLMQDPKNILILLLAGFAINEVKTFVLGNLYDFTSILYLKELKETSFLIYRMGQAFIIISLISYLSIKIKKIPKIVYTIGKNSLAIFVIHIFVVYNTYLSKGVTYFFENSMGIPQAIITGVFAAISTISIFLAYNKAKLYIATKKQNRLSMAKIKD